MNDYTKLDFFIHTLTFILIMLKLTEQIYISWWLVMSPVLLHLFFSIVFKDTKADP